MRDVVVIGGGLTGLSAAYELEQHNIDYTLIEVKPRVGGSIITTEQDGFILDGNGFITANTGDWSILSELGIEDALYETAEGHLMFKHGTQTLINALDSKLNGGRLMRMAVSSIGELEGKFTICMENGLLLDARALVITVPARFAERMFYGYINDISDALREFHYDSVHRVSVGYPREQIPERFFPRFIDLLHPFQHWTDHPSRVPDGHILFQVGVRAKPDSEEARLVNAIGKSFRWKEAQPVVQRIDHWAEADPLSCYDATHQTNMNTIRENLPDGIVARWQ